jgi:hypothetical protein
MKSGISVFFVILFVGCHTKMLVTESNDSGSVTDSVLLLLVNLQKGLYEKGPVIWLNYFEKTHDFYMSSGGRVVFEDYAAAKQFIETGLVKKFSSVHLTLSKLRIDSLSPTLAGIGAGFHEDLIDSAGITTTADGYLIAIAKQTVAGWKFRNLHWSFLK